MIQSIKSRCKKDITTIINFIRDKDLLLIWIILTLVFFGIIITVIDCCIFYLEPIDEQITCQNDARNFLRIIILLNTISIISAGILGAIQSHSIINIFSAFTNNCFKEYSIIYKIGLFMQLLCSIIFVCFGILVSILILVVNCPCVLIPFKILYKMIKNRKTKKSNILIQELNDIKCIDKNII